ncbi:ComF family protein [Fictibacillus sp. Mic-4]|uniref:ComF family protein n=1 Tax=Fictibacillus sp. Mic-4 TaxID=3132826 RepID=UPI003CED0A2E
MKHCLYCDQLYIDEVSWRFFLGLNEETTLCSICRGSLQEIHGEICHCCGRPLSLFPEKYRQDQLCYDCVRWEKEKNWQGLLTKNRSLYIYNDHLKEMIARIKYRGDAKLIEAFQLPLKKLFKKHFKDYTVVPIPLSEKRHYERGFNQAELLARLLDVPVMNALVRTIHEEKQSKKSRAERIAIKHPIFRMVEQQSVHSKNILLIDDVYTTGSTLRQAALALKEAGATTICSITLAR